jgi:hypothetical protein
MHCTANRLCVGARPVPAPLCTSKTASNEGKRLPLAQNTLPRPPIATLSPRENAFTSIAQPVPRTPKVPTSRPNPPVSNDPAPRRMAASLTPCQVVFARDSICYPALSTLSALSRFKPLERHPEGQDLDRYLSTEHGTWS